MSTCTHTQHMNSTHIAHTQAHNQAVNSKPDSKKTPTLDPCKNNMRPQGGDEVEQAVALQAQSMLSLLHEELGLEHHSGSHSGIHQRRQSGAPQRAGQQTCVLHESII